jgi:hypothetical protein
MPNQKFYLDSFEIKDGVYFYKKQGHKFSVNPASGKVTRDGEPMIAECVSVNSTENTNDTEGNIDKSLKLYTRSYPDPIQKVGTLASSEEICKIFEHQFFSYEPKDYSVLDTVNSDFRWEGVEASSLWLQREFKNKGLIVERIGMNDSEFRKANDNVAACFRELAQKKSSIYQILQRNMLQYLSENCYDQKYKPIKTVDDKGNIVLTHVAVKSDPCIYFNYNSGRYSDWNSTTFALMLVWKEAHPILQTILDNGYKILSERVIYRDQVDAQNKKIEQERRIANEKRLAEINLKWNTYNSRDKTLMESVYNFASTGMVQGKKSDYWIEETSCVMVNGSRKVDNRNLNMTAFRIFPEFIGTTWYRVSTDANFRITTSADIPLDRLQQAWTLAFEECPGKRSRF